MPVSIVCKHSGHDVEEEKPYNEAYDPYWPHCFMKAIPEPTFEELCEATQRFFSLEPMYVTDDGILIALKIHLYTKLGYEKYGMPRMIRDEDREGIIGVVEFWSDVDKNFKTREEFADSFNKASQEFLEKEQSRSIEDVLGVVED